MALRRIEGRRPVINTVGGARGRCALHKSRGELLPTERHSAELLGWWAESWAAADAMVVRGTRTDGQIANWVSAGAIAPPRGHHLLPLANHVYTPSVGLRRAGCPVCLSTCVSVCLERTDRPHPPPQREAARTLALDPELWETLALASDVVAEQEAAAARARVRAERRRRSRHQARRRSAPDEEEELGHRWPDHGGDSDHEHDDELSSYGSSRSGSEVCSTPRYY
eukprot:COSAG01_NODE_7759_length_3065_cov_2.277871_3_plen_225_part_00